VLLLGAQSVVELTHLRNKIAREVFDFWVFGDALSHYRKSHDFFRQIVTRIAAV